MNLHWQSRTVDRLRSLALLSCLGLIVGGCAGGFSTGSRPVQSEAPVFHSPEGSTLVSKPALMPESLPNGSLWVEDAPLLTMFSDRKARTVGDIVTIRIAESSAATNKASTATDRTSSLSASLDAFFNAEKGFPADKAFFNPFSKVAGGMSHDFEGNGTTRRSGDLSAYLTALVVEVLPNGNLVVSGSREVLINNENQIIRLTGVVRPRDISADNQVLSTFVADARIAYSGRGVVDDNQKPGWLTTILMKVWPF